MWGPWSRLVYLNAIWGELGVELNWAFFFGGWSVWNLRGRALPGELSWNTSHPTFPHCSSGCLGQRSKGPAGTQSCFVLSHPCGSLPPPFSHILPCLMIFRATNTFSLTLFLSSDLTVRIGFSASFWLRNIFIPSFFSKHILFLSS